MFYISPVFAAPWQQKVSRAIDLYKQKQQQQINKQNYTKLN